MGSGINTTFRQVGIATGVAALGAVFQSRVDSKLRRAAAERARPGFAEIVASGGAQRGRSVAPPGQQAERRQPSNAPSSAASTRSS